MNGHLTVYIAQPSHYLLHSVASFSKENQENISRYQLLFHVWPFSYHAVVWKL